MNLSTIDWTILIALFILLNISGYLCRKYIKGVADFLVAGRGVGRYLGVGAASMMGVGAVTILGIWQQNYKAGFVGQWWYMLTPAFGIIVALTGWGIYRWRQSRAMTLGQLIEMRYSKRTRIFFGILAYAAGVLNMGIFPAVGAGFFVYYCGFPAQFSLAGITIPTILPIMILLVGTAVAMCFFGGQVTLIVTDFLQSLFVNLMLIAIMVAIYRMFTWQQFTQAFRSAPNADALLHPFRTEGASEFNKWFFFINVYWLFYNVISWSPDTMQVSSARDAHEGRMMRVMFQMKQLAMIGLGITVLPWAAFVLMNHPDFAAQAAQVNHALASIANQQVRSQMLTPAAIIHILPPGLLGAFAAVILFAFITTHDSYLLAWGGLLIQDVIIPLKGKRLSPKQHMMWIRISVLGVAIFIVLFSLFFKQVDNIFMFFDISASLYIGAAGVVLLGALYFKRGTTTAAWVTMIVGAALSITGFIFRCIKPTFLDGRIMAFWVTIVCIATYILVSYMGTDPRIDMDVMLNRPKKKQKRNWFRWPDYVPKSDRILIPAILFCVAVFLIAFACVCIYNLNHDVPTESWLAFWHFYLYAMFIIGSAFLVWITIGGIRDLIRLFAKLKTETLNIRDDGSVEGRHASG